jgi:hypothetical protein
MKVVTCEASRVGRVWAQNTPRRCAEQALLERLRRCALRAGAAAHEVGAWIRRKHGSVTVTRPVQRPDGSLAAGTSLPCVTCRRLLDRLGVRWSATAPDGRTVDSSSFEGKSKPTGRQAAEFEAQRRRKLS